MEREIDEMRREMKKEMNDMKSLIISLISLIRNSDVLQTSKTYFNYFSTALSTQAHISPPPMDLVDPVSWGTADPF